MGTQPKTPTRRKASPLGLAVTHTGHAVVALISLALGIPALLMLGLLSLLHWAFHHAARGLGFAKGWWVLFWGDAARTVCRGR